MAISGKQSWIDTSDVFSLFPTLVWKIQLRAEVHKPIDASALGLLHSLRQGQPELKSGEAWQSGHALHRREELHALCDCVSRAAASVLQFLKIGEPAIEITGCWLNLYAPGAVHRAHSRRMTGLGRFPTVGPMVNYRPIANFACLPLVRDLANHAAGIPCSENALGNIPRDDTASTDHGPRTDVDPREDERAAPYPHVGTDLHRLAVLPPPA
jgi:hypothetical protein